LYSKMRIWAYEGLSDFYYEPATGRGPMTLARNDR
jgi:hypothetical protein